MAGNSLRISTDQVTQIADSIDAENKKLSDELKACKAAIDSLENIWEGEAAQATISSFTEFSNKFFQNYEDVIDQYVKFLRNNVAQGYFETETQNISLADAFK